MLCRHLFRTFCISNEFKHVQFGLHPHRLNVFLIKYGICTTNGLKMNQVTGKRLQKSCVQNFCMRHKSHKSFMDDEKLSDMESDEDDGNEIADEITLADVKNLPEDPDVPNGYKTKMLSEGEFVDILVEKSDVDQPTNTVTVRRVKVIKVFQQTTKKGKPKVAIRVWLKPFEVKR
ncbi:hypothetical protein MAR_019260 [Mya arenaria]|uniref:Mitochondrial transcription rescue factor 1 C-terminal domain-containing protein n=1 Tax=Mya arenaria TaxID=6604 RepID=A0ABY7EK41_MYAAR|nr:hypothetical protein MAR_019260 [Mya arenaria]